MASTFTPRQSLSQVLVPICHEIRSTWHGRLCKFQLTLKFVNYYVTYMIGYMYLLPACQHWCKVPSIQNILHVHAQDWSGMWTCPSKKNSGRFNNVLLGTKAWGRWLSYGIPYTKTNHRKSSDFNINWSWKASGGTLRITNAEKWWQTTPTACF